MSGKAGGTWERPCYYTLGCGHTGRNLGLQRACLMGAAATRSHGPQAESGRNGLASP